MSIISDKCSGFSETLYDVSIFKADVKFFLINTWLKSWQKKPQTSNVRGFVSSTSEEINQVYLMLIFNFSEIQ